MGYHVRVMKPRLLTPEPTEHEIQHAAYLLWEQQGRPVGCDVEIWFAAKARLQHTLPHHGADPHRAKEAPHRASDAPVAVPVGR